MTPCPAILERTHYGRWPKPPMTPKERREIWRRRWETLTVEQTLGTEGTQDHPDLTDDNEPDYAHAY